MEEQKLTCKECKKEVFENFKDYHICCTPTNSNYKIIKCNECLSKMRLVLQK